MIMKRIVLACALLAWAIPAQAFAPSLPTDGSDARPAFDLAIDD